MKTLAELVERYNRNIRRNEDWQLSDFRNRYKPLEELIEDAVWGYLPDRTRDKHERRILKTALNQMVSRLLEPIMLEEIKRSKSFDEVFTIIYELKVPNFDSLCVYDTAHRLGAYFNLYPEVVYLHCGALEGAENLFGGTEFKRLAKYFCNDPNYPYLNKEQFPEELQELEPYHIENFLCHFKDELLQLAKKLRGEE